MMRLEPITLELLPLERMESFVIKALAVAARSEDDVCWELHSDASPGSYPRTIRIVGGRRRHLQINRLLVAVAEGIAYADVDQACHSCDNPPCINPSHIWHGDSSANHYDMVAKGRQARFAQHGTRSRYNGGCRCPSCRTSQRVYHRERNGVQHPAGPHRSAEMRERVRRLYVETGAGQRELAVQVGIPYQTIAKWVNGLRPPRRDGAGRFV